MITGFIILYVLRVSGYLLMSFYVQCVGIYELKIYEVYFQIHAGKYKTFIAGTPF